MKTSSFLSLNWRDLVKGLLMAILTPVVVIVQQSIEAGVFTFDWKSIGLAAVGGGIAYLIKNFFTKESFPQKIATDPKEELVGGRPDER